MYKEFDAYLSGYFTEGYWYDEAVPIAQDMLLRFSQHDWIALCDEALLKSIDWQKRLAYCLGNGTSEDELKILLVLLDSSDDKELFETCVDSLRSFTTPESKQMILNTPFLIDRVKESILKAGVVTKKVLEDFLIKVSK